MYEASERVIRTLVRHDWKVSGRHVSRNVTMIVTPKVVAEVRRHFNCSRLEGAELEDQGEVGTRLTHWEKRVFEVHIHTHTHIHYRSIISKTYPLNEFRTKR